MDRYDELKTRKKDRGNVYVISLPSEFRKDTRILTTYTPRVAERFDNIAHKFYGDSTKWFVIAKANKEVRGRLLATPGKELVIPRI